MRLMKEKIVEFRLLPNLHAKIYAAPAQVLIGSSNLSCAGRRTQFEANHRVRVNDPDFREIHRTAETYRHQGKPTTPHFEVGLPPVLEDKTNDLTM